MSAFILWLFLSLSATPPSPGDAMTVTASIYAPTAPYSGTATLETPWGTQGQQFAAEPDKAATLAYTLRIPNKIRPGVYTLTLRAGGVVERRQFAVCCVPQPPARRRVWLAMVAR